MCYIIFGCMEARGRCFGICSGFSLLRRGQSSREDVRTSLRLLVCSEIKSAGAGASAFPFIFKKTRYKCRSSVVNCIFNSKSKSNK